MSLGLEEASRRAGHGLDIPLAVDSDDEVIKVYARALPYAHSTTDDVALLFSGDVGKPLTAVERAIKRRTGRVDVLLGGPPCQGYSDLNNHTRRKDPKNALYLRMVRAAEVLNPRVVVVENVAQVLLDSARVVMTASKALVDAGYRVAGRVVDLRRVGVPQRRRRFLLLASRVRGLDPAIALESLGTALGNHPDRTVYWAIGDLAGRASGSRYDTPSRLSKTNRKRIAYLFEKGLHNLPNRERPGCHQRDDHTYVSMYGRLSWHAPAQTITTGFGSMGQGRYVHPSRRRTITPHEAARLQTFPDWFDFGERTLRGKLATMIGNAVPPLLMIELGARIVCAVAVTAAVPQRKRA